MMKLTSKYTFTLAIFLLMQLMACSPQKKVVSVIDNYNNWQWDNVHVAANDYISLAVVPEAGGRILEYNLGDVKSLWVNSKMQGKSFAPTEEVKRNEWRNFGGYRLVPIPRDNFAINRKGEKVKRWPPPAILGDSPYSVKIVKQKDGTESIVATSGVQELPVPTYDNKAKEFIRPTSIDEQFVYSRKLTTDTHSSKVYLQHKMTNVGEKPLKRGVMTSSQHVSESEVGKHDGQHFVAYVPFDTLHRLPSGEQFEVTNDKDARWRYVDRNRMPLDKENPEHIAKYYNHGTNWTGEVAPGIFEVHYDYNLMSGLHIVAAKPWICYANKLTNTVFAKMIEPFDPSEFEYDHGLNVSIFCSGLSEGYIETEVKTPLYTLAPNESWTYDEVHGAAQVANLPVLDVVDAGVITERLSVQNGKVSGAYGVFYGGKALLRYLDNKGMKITDVALAAVSPLQPLTVSSSMEKQGAASIQLIIVDEKDNEHQLDTTTL